ncbi:leucine-rich repeat domain-containing protein [Planctomycetota bacterium]
MEPVTQKNQYCLIHWILFAALSLLLCNTLVGAQPVVFGDAKLKAVVEARLGVADPTQSDMLDLTYLRAEHTTIADLTGLEYATNLTQLWMAYNSITDISPIAGLTKLTMLDIAHGQISDIGPVSNLTNLTWLNIGANPFGNISAISRLTKLKLIYVSGEFVSDLTPISSLTQPIDKLLFSYTQVSDLSPLMGMTNIRNLYANNNPIVDCSAISTMTGVHHIDISACQITDAYPLTFLPKLQRLYINDNLLSCNSHDCLDQMRSNGVSITADPRPNYCDSPIPVADAGETQRVAVGDVVFLDGSRSHDPEGGAIEYAWEFVSLPVNSHAVLVDADMPRPCFYADSQGAYKIQLTVNNGTWNSKPDQVLVTAIPSQAMLSVVLANIIEYIAGMPEESFHNKNSAEVLIQKLEEVLSQVEAGHFKGAQQKLIHDVLAKTNGCNVGDAPDKNDWIITCEEQVKIYPLIERAIELLGRLLDNK